ncbi:thiaminase /4-amino-5-aminomethyl-2-methylpyrimidine deaminase [Pelagirhabdus alkalitolerans]|uniref:Aminopyrimidine aminohydrolase n=1 Tax=Pelagirhabdus alkalitolerans TaxID=1612202 RepID=A0A1G6H7I5_9BACI|nr:thiaminase II [Pelagirhabdus alkalitolerans]SDB90230.1 thiaminase /4-amino-5-aminomethyl-2-methylpyrimidine deaminase [Pelagirhabdus alkalitolerans]
MKFSEELRQEADPIWQASFNHPFVTGIGDGSLPVDRFRYYVLQDSYYLSSFARVQSLGGAMADSLEVTNRMAIHAQGTYEAEMDLHRTFTDMLDITDEEIKNFKPSPTAYAYSSHMYRAAQFGHLGDVIAAILPCYWVYYEIGEQLKTKQPDHPVYQKWIEAYGSDWFKELVDEQINRLDELAESVSDSDRERMKEHFLKSSQYEYMFWEMAYQKEQWPLDELNQ